MEGKIDTNITTIQTPQCTQSTLLTTDIYILVSSWVAVVCWKPPWLLSLVTWILPTVNGVTVARECAVEVNMTQTIEQLNNSAITCRYSGHDCSLAYQLSNVRYNEQFSPINFPWKSRNTNDVFSWANDLWKLSVLWKIPGGWRDLKRWKYEQWADLGSAH